jgi:hypothetical protein
MAAPPAHQAVSGGLKHYRRSSCQFLSPFRPALNFLTKKSFLCFHTNRFSDGMQGLP